MESERTRLFERRERVELFSRFYNAYISGKTEEAMRFAASYFYTFMQGSIYRYAQKHLVHATEILTSDDIVQSVAEKLVRIIIERKFEGNTPGEFEGLIWSASNYLLIDRVRRNVGRQVVPIDEPPFVNISTGEQFGDPEFDRRLQLAFGLLTNNQREVLSLVLEGYTFAEIGAMLDIDSVTARVLAFRARKKLRELRASFGL